MIALQTVNVILVVIAIVRVKNNFMNKKEKLYRSKKDRIVFGVCGGLADYFDLDPLIVRLVFLALFFGGGSGAIIYILFAILVPSQDQNNPGIADNIKVLEQDSKKVDWSFAFGLILIIIGVTILLSSLPLFKVIWLNFWPILLMVIGLAIIFKKR